MPLANGPFKILEKVNDGVKQQFEKSNATYERAGQQTKKGSKFSLILVVLSGSIFKQKGFLTKKNSNLLP